MRWNTAQTENPPGGSHIGRCIRVIDLGTRQHSWNNETWFARDVRLTFELPNELMTGKYKPELKGRPFGANITVKQSLHPSSTLCKLLESWRGRKFSKEEKSTFDPRTLLGKACRIQLIEEGDFVNIDSLAPLGKGETCPPQVNPSVFFSLERDLFDQKVMASFPEKLRLELMQTPEYKALMSPSAAESPQAEAPEEHDDVPW